MLTPEQIKPNLIDRAIGYFDPIRAAKRIRGRAMMAWTGSYFGASSSRRSTKQWVTSTGDADSDLLYDLPKLRERSRDLCRNTPLAVGAISTALTNTVGTGLKLQSRIDRDVIRMDEDQADEWEAKTEREFRLWAESQECDAARTQNFASIQELVFRQTLENGDVFTLTPRFKRGNFPYMLKLQIVEADRICNEKWKQNTETLVEGVEKDPNGAPTAYHILNQHPGSDIVSKKSFTWTVVPAFGAKTDLRNVIHNYRVLRPGQTRGVPYLAPVIESLKMLDRYTEAELMAAVISSMFTVFIKTEGGGLDVDFTGLGAETGATSTDTDMKLGNGAIVGLAKGESIDTANPLRPNTAFSPFVQAIMEQIGTALEIPYEIIVRHFSSSYSASRAALLEAWRFFRGRRAWLALNFCQPVYEIWLYEAIAAGRIAAPGFFSDPLLRKSYAGAVWVGDAPGYIDPAKDVSASKERMELGISTLDEETTLITGGDMEKNLPRIRKERKELAEIGLWQPVQMRKPQIQYLPKGEQEE